MSNETLKKTRCKAKPVGSPPAYPLTACYLLLICQLIGTPMFSAALALFFSEFTETTTVLKIVMV